MIMENIRIAFLQIDIQWGKVRHNLDFIDNYFEGAPEADIYLLPETFATGFVTKKNELLKAVDPINVDSILEALRLWAKKKNAWVGGSLFIQKDDRYRNRFMMFNPQGESKEYDKRHLFGIAGEKDFFQGGSYRQVIEINGWRFLLAVCYDLRFPVWMRQQKIDSKYEYDGILVCANWPESRHNAWEVLLRARAIENQCYITGINRIGTDGFGSNHIGGSKTIGPLGEDISTAENSTEGWTVSKLESIHLHAVRKRYPFLDDADSFMIK